MNPIYSILESPYRWLIFAGISLGTAILGALMMIAYVWPHWLALAWFYLGLAVALYFLARAAVDWWRNLDSRIIVIDPTQEAEDELDEEARAN